MQRSDLWGVGAAVLSSLIGGSAVAVTRWVIGATDPLMLAVLRYGLGALFLLPVAFLLDGRRIVPRGRDWPAVIGLGLLFCAAFPLLFNAALARTTAAHGALALSTMPILTLALAAFVRAERPSGGRLAGVGLAIAGVALALGSGLRDAGASLAGDLLMIGTALCGAVYNVAARPYLKRYPAMGFTGFCLAVGAVGLTVPGAIGGWFASLPGFEPAQWSAVLFLGVIGCALTFFLWVWALEHTTPTRVAVSVTANPIVAILLGATLLGEPVGANLVAGLVLVVSGIALAAKT